MALRDEMEMEDVNGSQFQKTFMKPLKKQFYVDSILLGYSSFNR